MIRFRRGYAREVWPRAERRFRLSITSRTAAARLGSPVRTKMAAHRQPSIEFSGKMSIAMIRQRPNPLFVADAQALLRGDLADATEPQFGKSFPPRVEQRNGIVAGDRTQQLKILAVSQRGQQGWSGGRLGTRRQLGRPAHGNGIGQQIG